jgi:hypothetical protein
MKLLEKVKSDCAHLDIYEELLESVGMLEDVFKAMLDDGEYATEMEAYKKLKHLLELGNFLKD